MAGKPSWRLKLERAEVHLTHINDLLAPLWETHNYSITERFEEDGEWVYYAHTHEAPDPFVSVILGDFMFNVRSALDHLAVSLVPPRRKYSAFFPICTIDPEQDHPGDVKGDADRRASWEKATTGMKPPALAIIRASQPYNIEPPAELRHLGPEHHVLALLGAFQNADKHRQLVVMTSALNPRHVNFTDRSTGQRWEVDPARVDGIMAKNGAVVFRSPTQMHVEAEGAAEIAVRISKDVRGPYRKIPDFPNDLLKVIYRITDQIEAL